MRLMMLSLGLSSLLLLGLPGCTSNHEARTPQEFIERYSKAWEQGDVDAILSMQKRKDLSPGDVSAEMKQSLERAASEEEKEEIGKAIRQKGLAYIAWTHTEFVSEHSHDDHIHVTVRVDYAVSEVILVREDGLLKIHPNPGSFE
jgi:hypothetical protein